MNSVTKSELQREILLELFERWQNKYGIEHVWGDMELLWKMIAGYVFTTWGGDRC